MSSPTRLSPPQPEDRTTPFPAEIAVVWALLAVVAVEIAVTYARLPATELYHVSGSGLTGGASRVLVFANFPAALVAIPVAVLGERLRSGAARMVVGISIVLSAAVFWPGVVKQSDLDARPVNAIAAVGVLLALAISVAAARGLGRPRWAERQLGDPVRIALAGGVLLLGVPWAAADRASSSTASPCSGASSRPASRRIACPGCLRSRLPSITATTMAWTGSCSF